MEFVGKIPCRSVQGEYEWLCSYQFKVCAEIHSAIFEYFEIYYNRQRLHELNDYFTLDEY